MCSPEHSAPAAGLPEMNVTDGDARDVAVYPYSRE